MTKKAAAPETTATLESAFAGSPRHMAHLATLRKLEGAHSLLLELAHTLECRNPNIPVTELKTALAAAAQGVVTVERMMLLNELRALDEKARIVADLALRNVCFHYKV
ncbi:hypothetical protein ACLKMY_32870 [Paraburkholderia mimosarum]|uniref:hypothetical protein n=1 Tax=Paraburkholderia mimosarum TaxID=312026 RepID=UPI0039C2CE08